MRAPLRILPLLALLAAAAGSAHAAAVTNLWVRKTGGDPKASTAANWSLGHAPRADEVAVFSPRHPTAAIWDAAAPKEIGGLVLSRGYVAVVTVETSRGGPLQSLRVHGDVVVDGGALTHPQNADSDAWWLNVVADGAIRVGPEGIVSVSGKGYAPRRGPAAGHEPGWGASHGGQGAPRALADVTRPPLTCDSILNPDQPGSGGTVRDGAPATVGHGGGVILFEAGGDVVVLGPLRADADNRSPNGVLSGGAAGGTVRVKSGGTIRVEGDGRITADGGAAFADKGGGGGGGRIALLCRAEKAAVLNLSSSADLRRSIHANGGVGDTNSRDNVRTDTHLRAAAGTVYVGRWGEGVVPGSGTVCVFNSQRPSLAATRLPGDLTENGAAELRDAALSLQAGGFVQLTAPTSVRIVSFRSSDCGFDLNGNPITAGSFVSGDGRERLETPGAHYNNDDPALGPVLFSGGTAIVQPYFAPAL